MDDELIVKLYWDRSEHAISETSQKYGAYCHSIAYGILQSREDAEESVNDTYMDAWNAMPPHRPSILATFLGKITRRISIDRWRSLNRIKRGGGEVTLALEELEQCIAGGQSPEREIEKKELVQVIKSFSGQAPDSGTAGISGPVLVHGIHSADCGPFPVFSKQGNIHVVPNPKQTPQAT